MNLFALFWFQIFLTQRYFSAMGKEVAPEIRENYSFYNPLLKERKSIFHEVIEISEIGNHANFLQTTKVEKYVSVNKRYSLL